ncbi:hypothetical protein B7P43_G15866 [Cryptotermes secundus]|uniref:Uncharacterized protein n=1 Tax=Cryptotermes secundus TaxID=105785 RepID=A0A2J7R6I3_9NEOP|nr:hypothetical protein B7P43_G15866 [Cryptotermes secundus]
MALCHNSKLGFKGVSKHRDFTSIKIPCCRRQFDRLLKDTAVSIMRMELLRVGPVLWRYLNFNLIGKSRVS